MFIFKDANGNLTEAPADFDVNNPDYAMLHEVVEILCVGKVLVKQLKLVVKDKAEDAVTPRKKRVSQEQDQ